jgi:SAM-dependent methyltransferase
MILPLALILATAGPPDVNPHQEQRIDPARIHTYPRQSYQLADFPAEGWILDIGGGGEGVIGRLKGSQVVAIDLYAWGMKRTPSGPLKLVMDATDLKFLDASFGTVTSFFTLMYMTPEQQSKAVAEAFRVLRPGGRLNVWEVDLPVSQDPTKDVAIFPFEFRLPRESVETGYGTFFPKTAWDAAYYRRLGAAAGFSIEKESADGRVLSFVFRKP